eukprot:SM000279S10400  [mRNA]  locus=s279:93578:98226:- [translate_table: standard]
MAMKAWLQRLLHTATHPSSAAGRHQPLPQNDGEHDEEPGDEGEGEGHTYPSGDGGARRGDADAAGFHPAPMLHEVPWWQRWLGTAPPVAYHEANELDTERELEADEAAQVEAALQASLRDPGRAPPAADPDASRSSDAAGGGCDEDRDLALALSLSEQEYTQARAAEEEEHRRRRQAEEAAEKEGRRSAALLRQRQLERDEEVARALQEEMDLLVRPILLLPSSLTPLRRASVWPACASLSGAAILSLAQDVQAQPGGPPSGASAGSAGSGRPEAAGPLGTCGKCGRPLGLGRYVAGMGATFHPACFACAKCGRAITEREFKVMGTEPYHPSCHQELFHPRCHVCHDYVSSSKVKAKYLEDPSIPPRNGVIEYRASPFWGERYCPGHESDGTPRCAGCSRLEARGAEYVALEDGRRLCLACCDSVVVDTADCQPLFRELLHFYDVMGMRITQEIPLLCVERQALNAARQGEKDVRAAPPPSAAPLILSFYLFPSQTKHHTAFAGHHSPETRGLCLTEEQTIHSVVSVPGFDRRGSFGRVQTHDETLHKHCEATAILVLYGLPRPLTSSILAHELMHAYLKLEGFPKLAPEIEEGICQVMANAWLHTQLSAAPSPHAAAKTATAVATLGPSSAASPIDSSGGAQQFVEYCMHNIAHDPSPVYGDGFRRGHAAVSTFGLQRTLDHIRLTGRFPP